MVHYIRFLKPPLLSKTNLKEYRISALIEITTDLGDSLLAKDVELSASVHTTRATAHSTIHKTVRWMAKSRVLAIEIDVARCLLQLPARLYVTRTPSHPEDLLALSSLPATVSAWSAPFDDLNAKRADYLVERRLRFPDAGVLSTWEETGDSIARHIWDSGPIFLAYLDKARHDKHSIFFNTSRRPKPLRVLELGSGCGIVGIGLAQIIPNCDVLLTDLPEAQDILARNVECSSPAKSSRVSACILDWEKDLPKAILKRVHDAILVSDCTYNTDTIPALVSTLSKLSSISPQAVISLATKVRHSSEAEFFTLMEDAQFSIDALDSINLPTLAPDNDGDNETVEIYVFRRNRGVNEGNP